MERIIAIDYDNTLDMAGYPNVGKLDMNLVDDLIAWRKYGNAVILWTCRTGNELQQAIETCRQAGLEFDAVNENIPRIKALGFTSPKVLANYYIDDRAVGSQKVDEQCKEEIRMIKFAIAQANRLFPNMN